MFPVYMQQEILEISIQKLLNVNMELLPQTVYIICVDSGRCKHIFTCIMKNIFGCNVAQIIFNLIFAVFILLKSSLLPLKKHTTVSAQVSSQLTVMRGMGWGRGQKFPGPVGMRREYQNGDEAGWGWRRFSLNGVGTGTIFCPRVTLYFQSQ